MHFWSPITCTRGEKNTFSLGCLHWVQVPYNIGITFDVFLYEGKQFVSRICDASERIDKCKSLWWDKYNDAFIHLHKLITLNYSSITTILKLEKKNIVAALKFSNLHLISTFFKKNSNLNVEFFLIIVLPFFLELLACVSRCNIG